METIVINKKKFDYSPSLEAYVNRDIPTMPLVFDGKNVVPLQAYEVSRTRTVGADGSVSQTDTIKFVQQHEQAKQKHQIALLKLRTQLGYNYDGATFYAVPYDTVKVGKHSFQRFTLTTLKPETEPLEQINEAKRKALAALREWRTLQNRYVSQQVQTLFDK
jgi:LAS superfamily LD-carboxypeptidase LdcB